VALAADRAAGWVRLAQRTAGERRIGLIVSDYPGVGGAASGQVAHAVGLDSFASLEAILTRLDAAGYRCGRVAAAGWPRRWAGARVCGF
jgi:cobaltochelatase CobN subunit (EC 6.6.1.2)